MGRSEHYVEVLGEKTQRAPYHTAVLAAAMLVEAAFPGQGRGAAQLPSATNKAAAGRSRYILRLNMKYPLLVQFRLEPVLQSDEAVVE